MKDFVFAAFADEAGASLDAQIAALTRNRIPYLEIRNADGENIANMSNARAGEIRKKLDAAGIQVWSLGSPYGKISMEDDFEPHLELFRRGLEKAGILGSRYIRLFSFFIPEGKKPEDYRNAVLERLSRFCEAAKGSGITLCHENEKAIYGDVAVRCLDIHREIPELRAVFDPANFIQCGQDTKEAWEMLKPYVTYMHVKDAQADGFVVPAGAGIGEVPYLLSQYQGTVLTVEPHLTVFEGLAELENGGKVSGIGSYRYPTADAAFDAAVAAVRDILA